MEQKIIDPSGTRNYGVGDIVYLWYDKGVPTCKAEVLEYDGERWRFKPLEKQSVYNEKDGVIEFSHKPVIFAKEADERRAKNDTI